MGLSDWKEEGKEWGALPPVHYNEETIQLASLYGPWCWLPQTGQPVPSFYWLKPRGAQQQDTWKDWSDRRPSNFSFVSKEKQGHWILGGRGPLVCVRVCVTLLVNVIKPWKSSPWVYWVVLLPTSHMKWLWTRDYLHSENVITPYWLIRPACREVQCWCQPWQSLMMVLFPVLHGWWFSI